MFRLGKILFIAAILSCLSACSCDDGYDEGYDGDVIISSCSVPQVPLDIEKKKLVLVESEAELNRIFAGHTKELPQINFRKTKLLLLHGASARQVTDIIVDYFIKIQDGDGYYMHVTVEDADIEKDCSWTAAYLVPRSFNSPICLFLSFSHGVYHYGGEWLYF